VTTDLVAVEQEMADAAGILVYWSLCDSVYLEDLRDALSNEGLESWLPEPPTLETSAHRAAQTCAGSGKGSRRMLVRPLRRRGAWDIVEETVEKQDDGKDKLNHQALVRVEIEQTDNGKQLKVGPFRHSDLRPTTQALVDRIRRLTPALQGMLSSTDISSWLLSILDKRVSAVGLRQRGGIYFIPRDQVETWHHVVGALRAISSHQLFEIPAMRSDEAVEAVLAAVRREAQEKLQQMEDYLCGDKVSTRGINAWTRDLEKIREKTARYAALLGEELPDLEQKEEHCAGLLTAAQLKKGSEKEK
jgi:hypothetical protein